MPVELTLYVCHIDDRGPKPHACRRAHEALREAGHEYEKVIFGRGRPFGLFTRGRRPRLKELSGQEQLPVLHLRDGTTIAGASNIVAWAKTNRPGMSRAGASGTQPVALVEFPADDPERARRFWQGMLGAELEPRAEDEGAGWQSRSTLPPIGVHARGAGPGDTFSLAYFAVDDVAAGLERVKALGGQVIHPGERWAICRDSEGSPFGLAARPAQGANARPAETPFTPGDS
ncbi:MAG TPA: VOC family protein [Solirubrobacteraceae bacterium]|nr:VOC family protein [Solirubrobacteraceae bacterium]